MFIDTHCHLNLMTGKDAGKPLSSDDLIRIQQICKQANANNIGKIINIGGSLEDSLDSVQLAKLIDCVYAVVGIHPCDCGHDWQEKFTQIKKLVQNKIENKIIGIGESGLDYYHKPYDAQLQESVFRNHIEFALEIKLPLVIHIRDAGDELLKILEEYIKDGLHGVIHCFSQGTDFADQILKWGFYIGIDGHITYPKNNALREIIKNIPLDRLLLETDAPFLPPQQFRGKQNSPVYICAIAQFIAELRNINITELEEATTQNTKDLFGI